LRAEALRSFPELQSACQELRLVQNTVRIEAQATTLTLIGLGWATGINGPLLRRSAIGMLNTVLFLIFWAAYIIPIAIPLLWLVFTIVTHSRQAKPAYVNNKDGKASLSYCMVPRCGTFTRTSPATAPFAPRRRWDLKRSCGRFPRGRYARPPALAAHSRRRLGQRLELHAAVLGFSGKFCVSGAERALAAGKS